MPLDGVAASTGRVVILTTNYPKRLDEALKRPGRIDIKVKFRLTKRDEMEEMFVLMSRAKRRADSNTAEPETIRILAKKFADQLPEDELSAAQLQGYLIKKHMYCVNKRMKAKEASWSSGEYQS